MAWLPEQEGDWAGMFLRDGIKSGVQSGEGRRCYIDIEGDGILWASGSKGAVTQCWCLAAVDMDTGEEFYWGVDMGNVEEGVRFLAQCSMLAGHHAIGYDYPALERLYPWFKRPAKSWDSLVIAKVIWPPDALVEADMKLIARGKLPGHMLKRHSLEAWGYRTGTHKGDYKGGFHEWCPAQAIYLMGDIRGGMALWKLIETKGFPEATFEVECRVARIIHEQWECGVQFDMDKAIVLASELTNQKQRIETRLVEAFGSWWEPLDNPENGAVFGASVNRKCVGSPDITLPRYGKTGKRLKDYVGPPVDECIKGDRYVRIERTTFSPSNRHHLGKRLVDVYGWKPKAFGGKDKNIPTVDEGTLEEIPEAVLPADMRQLILDYFVVSKTYAMLASGARSWITAASHPASLEGAQRTVYIPGRIHHEMDTVGAVTRRGIHKNPNLGQVPSVTMEKGADGKEHVVRGLAGRYGWESRELFRADDRWEQTGVDASSLELIDLGHYLEPLDGGAFRDRVCDPARDAHREHAALCNLLRGEAKTTIYLKIYGGSSYKLSLALDVTPDEIPEMLTYKGLPQLLRSLEKRFDAEFVRKLDDRQRAKIAKARIIIIKLEAGITGLADLIKAVQGAATRGWLKAIDGSRIHIRKAHAALNSLLQSAGAITCKLWMVLVHDELERRGLRKNVDWKQTLWVHDELQFTHRPGLGPIIKEVAEQCMVQAGEMLKLRGKYRTSGATGENWAQCH